MPTSPTPIDALPTPVPSSTDPANFDTRADALLTALPTAVDQINDAASNVYANAVETAASAVEAVAARDAAIAASGADMWSAATSYATGEAVISPTNYLAYRRKSPGGVDATDPSASSALWEPMSITRLGAYGLEYWDGWEWIPTGWAELGTQSTASGTGITFAGIPLWVRELVILPAGVSHSGVAHTRIRLGTSGGLVTTGYAGIRQYINMASSTVGAAPTDGFYIHQNGAGVIVHGAIRLVRYGNTWHINGNHGDVGSQGSIPIAGSIALASALTQIEIAPTATAFDGGSISLLGRA